MSASSRLRRLVVPGAMATVMLAVLLALGTWQVERLQWKRGLLAQIARAEAAPAVPLLAEPASFAPAPAPYSPAPYSKVRVTGHLRDDAAAFYGAEVRDTPSGTLLGSHLIVPLERDGADAVLVDRGWVPDKRPAPIARGNGEVTVEGYIRPSDEPGLFSAPDNPATRRFFTLNAPAIGAALGLQRVAPYVLIAVGQPPPERYPDPARHLPRPVNNHLSYAITWYGLAAALVVIFILWARRILNE